MNTRAELQTIQQMEYMHSPANTKRDFKKGPSGPFLFCFAEFNA